jgi:Holliday junction resolvase RusA-like endonuclease
MNLKPHQQTPDADNLFKAFTDTLFYWVKDLDWKKINDSQIWDLQGRKFWWEEWQIIFES